MRPIGYGCHGLALMACLIAPAPAVRADDAGQPLMTARDNRWGLGNTGIDCFTTPCPWRGVFVITADGSRSFPLSREDQAGPPPLRASDEDRRLIEEAFAQDRCVVAIGYFEAGDLVVRRLDGAC